MLSIKRVNREHEPDPATVTVSDRIVRAGMIRRGEVQSSTKPTGLALQIVNAGRKARGEKPL